MRFKYSRADQHDLEEAERVLRDPTEERIPFERVAAEFPTYEDRLARVKALSDAAERLFAACTEDSRTLFPQLVDDLLAGRVSELLVTVDPFGFVTIRRARR